MRREDIVPSIGAIFLLSALVNIWFHTNGASWLLNNLPQWIFRYLPEVTQWISEQRFTSPFIVWIPSGIMVLIGGLLLFGAG